MGQFQRPDNSHFLGIKSNWFLARCAANHIHKRRKLLQGRKTSDNLFVDVSYTQLLQNPLSTMVSVYKRLGMTLTPNVRDAMTVWLGKNKKDSRGGHLYSLKKYGLTQDDIDKHWREYCEYFEEYLD